MCFKCCSKLLITKHWVIKIVMQNVPGHRAEKKTPDEWTWCHDVVERWAGSDWHSEDADCWQHPKWVCSSPPGTGAPCFKDTGGRSLQAYTGYIQKRPACAAQGDVTVSDHGRTSQYHWRHELLHSAPTRACQRRRLTTWPTLCYSSH